VLCVHVNTKLLSLSLYEKQYTMSTVCLSSFIYKIVLLCFVEGVNKEAHRFLLSSYSVPPTSTSLPPSYSISMTRHH
jgi:hypothetical protein